MKAHEPLYYFPITTRLPNFKYANNSSALNHRAEAYLAKYSPAPERFLIVLLFTCTEEGDLFILFSYTNTKRKSRDLNSSKLHILAAHSIIISRHDRAPRQIINKITRTISF